MHTNNISKQNVAASHVVWNLPGVAHCIIPSRDESSAAARFFSALQSRCWRICDEVKASPRDTPTDAPLVWRKGSLACPSWTR